MNRRRLEEVRFPITVSIHKKKKGRREESIYSMYESTRVSMSTIVQSDFLALVPVSTIPPPTLLPVLALVLVPEIVLLAVVLPLPVVVVAGKVGRLVVM